ncbi:Trk-type K+ transport system, membrane component [Brevibacterium jeotgali]|uniref:Trk-type K+ transport system, membrane component n=2 Tax=Brevibacterium jeotgali TaxID=1262550 RepID=A0A2H1L0W5_9MICO|nr:Trk-type K+ transport system membrane component [Brevibacterium jeotgali]SMY10544.1 Trk-type K+ transport system, membrane component [Brevibacterium jeotgali]
MAGFALVAAVCSVLLALPVAARGPGSASVADAVLVAVSAVSVTGLTSVVTEQQWSSFGLGVITIAIQVGGIGILTAASLLGMAMSKRLGVRQRLLAAQATGASQLGQVGSLLRVVLLTMIAAEVVVTLLLLPRFLLRGEGVWEALWHAVFYAVSSFNNAGFTVHPGGMEHFADDPWILGVIGTAVFIGSLGFPVVFVMSVFWRTPRGWDLHTKLTLTVSAALVLVGWALLLVFETGNPRTLADTGPVATAGEVLFLSVMSRSGGFTTMDVQSMTQTSHVLLDVLMFIGGGSGSTAGGIKVTTLAVLVLASVSEARGLTDTTAFRRRIDPSSIRLAITVLLAGAGTVLLGTVVMLNVTDEPLDLVLFEVVSAFATCGLSVGVTERAPDAGLHVLSALMLIGRLGTITLASALSQRSQSRRYRYAEERPIVG